MILNLANAGGFQPPLKEKGPLKNGLQRSILFSFQERTLNSFKLPTEFLGSEIIRKISGTSHFRTLTMSHLVLKLHLAFLKCHHDFQIMTGTDFVNMTFRHMSWRNMPKHQMCKMCKFAQFGKIVKNDQNAKKHHFGGVKNRHISVCKSVNFGCSRPWKSRRIMYCLVYRHPPNFDQIGVYRKYGILPKTPKCWPVENLAILGMCNFDIRVHVAYVGIKNCRMIGRNFIPKS